MTLSRPKSIVRQRFLALALAGATAVIGFATAPPAAAGQQPRLCSTTPHLEGSFVQPWLVDEMSDAELTAQLDATNAACQSIELLQWTVDTKLHTSSYPTSLPGFTQDSRTDVVERFLAASDAAGKKVYMGLQLNDEWWSTYANDPAWIATEQGHSLAIAEELWAKYASHPSFVGWYLPLEVDNENFPDATSWDVMAGYYRAVGDRLHAMTPGKPVVTSPFYNVNGGLDAAGWQRMWEHILRASPLDIIALQDGVGVAHATAEDLPMWFGATREAIRAARPTTRLWSDSETFTPAFTPMPIGQVVRDLRAVRPYVELSVSFAYDHYDAPGQFSATYHRTYLDYLRRGTVERVRPTTPATLTARATDALSARLAWGASSDNIGVAAYRIVRNGAVVATVPGTQRSFVDASLVPETTYRYAVAALDAAGNLSPRSGAVSVRTPSAPVTTVDLSGGRPYTLSQTPSTSYPDGGGEATDGVVGPVDFSDPAWTGWLTSAPVSVAVDLGSPQPIAEVSSSWLQSPSVGIVPPTSVEVATSEDGLTWTTLVTTPTPAAGSGDVVTTFRAVSLARTARWVRFTAAVPGTGWTFLSEVSVRAR